METAQESIYLVNRNEYVGVPRRRQEGQLDRLVNRVKLYGPLVTAVGVALSGIKYPGHGPLFNSITEGPVGATGVMLMVGGWTAMQTGNAVRAVQKLVGFCKRCFSHVKQD